MSTTLFIGGGNMATALIGGLIQAGERPGNIAVADPNPDVLKRHKDDLGIHVFAHADDALDDAAVLVLAVKPQILPMVLADLQGRLNESQCVVSVAAGITVATIREALGDVPVVRTMPNTPALLGAGITGLYAGPGCGPGDRAAAEHIMAAAGATVWVDDEALIDAVTAISGSGPAYYYLVTEALIDAGVALGLAPETAEKLAVHTVHGAGAMALEGGANVAELRRRVTSPGGTTQAAIAALQDGGLESLMLKAARAAADRGRELAKESKTG